MSDLTPEQAARCDALARRIAELDPDWQQPGMAWLLSPTPVQEYRKRYHADIATPIYDKPSVCVPDWRNAATLGAILLGLGAFAVEVRHSAVGYVVAWDCGWGRWRDGALGATRAEAILAAKVAQLEAQNAK